MPIKLTTIVGARPQFIKAAALSREISISKDIQENIMHTGQHHDSNMSDVFFSELGIPKPAYHLGISGLEHGAMTGRMLEMIEKHLISHRPDIVVVYGDTNSTLAAAIAAAKLHIPVAHVEAGLRSFNRQMPEEINRILSDHCSDLLFTPTDQATINLINEGVQNSKIHQVGDIMFDVAQHFKNTSINLGISAQHHGLKAKSYVLATVHRQDNTDSPDRLRSILSALNKVASKVPVILPLHPRTRARIHEFEFSQLVGCIKIVDPLGYLEMTGLEREAAVIATDSGGVQKEAFFYRVPCVTMRDETEWTELVDAGWNRLESPQNGDIEKAIHQSIGTEGKDIYPYGKGDTAAQILSVISNYISK